MSRAGGRRSSAVYCESSDRSRPSSWRSATSWAGEAVWPRICRAGSPGSACVAANTRIETPSRMKTLSASRLAIQSVRLGRSSRPSPVPMFLQGWSHPRTRLDQVNESRFSWHRPSPQPVSSTLVNPVTFFE